jgi:hypothetical protein
MAREEGHFKKGNKYGKGTPKLPEEMKQAAKLGRKTFQAMMVKLASMPLEEFREFVKDPKITTMERIIGAVMLKAASGHDRSAALIWDRMIGKVKENIEVTMPKPVLIERPSGEQILLGVDQNSIDGEIVD